MSEQSQLGPSDNATVMLDIGGDIGALIITTTVSMLLAEIEVSHVDADPPLIARTSQCASDGDRPGPSMRRSTQASRPGSTPCGDWTANPLTRYRSWAVK